MGYFSHMENLLIRKATLADLDTLLEFEQELIKVERPFDPTIHPDPVSYYNLKQYIEDDTVCVLVAQVDGMVVASGYALQKMARTYLDHKAYAYLGFMYCRPQHRGKGIIQKLISHLKDWALQQGLVELRLTVYHQNINAVRAYEKSGFTSHINEMRLRLN